MRRDPDAPRGVLAWFAGNHVAANLMMAVLLIGGGFVATSTKVMVFPDIDPRTITVTVPYPGATPVEVEESVCRRIEEAVAGVEGIKRLRSVSREGTGTVTAELEDDADDREVLDDVKSAVDQIQNFPPEDAEQPRVVDAERVNPVITIAIHGGGSEKTLRELAYRVRDDLGALEGVSKLKVDGARRYEIAVEVSERALREHKLRFEDVSRAVSLFSLNLPGGTIRTEGAEILLRTSGQAYRRLDFEGIVMRTRPDGTRLLLRDIATVVDAFEDVERLSLFNGQPAVFVEVSRVGDQRVLDVEGKVKEYVGTLALPTGVEATTWSNRADTLRSRMSLLLRNGLLGLVLVFGCLVLFMNLRLAFWTTMGIPISFLGAFLFLPAFDASINMISLFAFILVLGIVVDDAIVVGENIFSKREQGLPPLRAAVEGVREVLVPASVAVLTTIVAFLPLYFTPGFFGDILWVVPIVVIACLMVSLFEAAFILPSHLGTGSAKPPRGLLPLIQGGFRGALRWFVHAIYLPVLRLALRGRYVTVAIGLVTLALTGALVYGGVIKSVLFPRIDGENVSVSVRMANGTPAVETQRVLDHILAAAEQTRHDFDEDAADDAPSVFRNVAAVLGDNALSRGGGGPHGGGPEESGANVAEVKIELSPSEDRTAASSEIEAKWRKLIGEIPGATSVSFRSGLLAAGDDISVELAHADLARLLQATEALKGRIAEFSGAVDVADSFEEGKRELRFSLTRAGLAAGLTLHDLARQVRQAFYGDIVQRVQRGRDDIRVLVRYSQEERRSLAAIEEMRVRLPRGTEVPFRTVAEVDEGRGYATIERTDRRRTVTVTASVDEKAGDATNINNSLKADVLPALVNEFPGLGFSFEGEERERMESLAGMLKAFAIALLCIFALLAAQLRSYAQPLLIMSVIPLGIVGAVMGHWILGYQLSFFSMFGLVALTGVVVNDSLILMDMINRKRADGMAPREAVIAGATRRFRPILFTTLTTSVGLLPMIAETSMQAQFLIPVAISLAFGVLFATVITLVIVPSLYLILDDLDRLRLRLAGVLSADDETPPAPPSAPRRQRPAAVGPIAEQAPTPDAGDGTP